MFASAGQQHPQIVPKEEESILNYLLEVRSSLAKLKQNRTQYLNSKDVQTTYQHVLTKVRELDDIRKNSHETPAKSAATLIHSTELHNRVDSVLDDVFQLLSLCFLTVGLKNSAPATYASLSTVESLLEHLNESNVFTHHDLSPIKERLEEISKIVEQKNSSPAYDVDGNDDRLREIDNERKKNKIEEDLLLRAKLKHCKDEYDILEGKLEEIDPSLSTVMEKLFRIRRGLLSLVASAKKTMSKSDINTNSLLQEQNDLQTNNESLTDDKHLVSQEYVHEKLSVLKNELSELESNRDDSGKFKSLESHQVAEKGQSVLNGLLDDCHDLVNDLSHQKNGGLTLDPYLQPIYEQLIDIKTTLENLMITRRWTLRETDLFSYQKKLNEIDNKRINGKFPTKSQDSKGQSILLYLLRRCYAIIYKLLESSEPVSEALQPIHNQLSTVRRCLLELKRMGGVNNERELYPYQMKLASLDNLRTEGIFYDSDGNIPEGQGILNALLAECFDILHELKVEAEERAQNSTSSDDSDDDDNGESGIDSNSNDSEPESKYQPE
ncbi:CPS_HP_G0138050.mRNA.1.CDS.1 [Saccharomyces cerevisiae]|nr:CPS_HP_G0071530.mRNA.1.CDS.1 [Saccharomyces cerevisiae]CAI5007321.1 CPS_HP_G0082260.mRNA.1.CDS.1 [Saccharomyces cerevisiae]CAI5135374.1 CPS_HP_G0138050.mRNA.1.CDS.1 [Saccharomyces cerevisiae]CAI6882354.1 CPS_HP_G0071530.mRNA.1.CDS.1 [Saccharomyces cerevisiae]CAI6924627.1 CPS_HP_G0082260.mRNA.1.CDS.1 [Saccharomyces cerevisiae]